MPAELRSKFEPLPPKIIRYRTYKQFDKEKFKTDCENYLSDINPSDLSVDGFKMLFLNALNKFAPVRKKYIRASHSRFINKWLITNKEIYVQIFSVNLKNHILRIYH